MTKTVLDLTMELKTTETHTKNSKHGHNKEQVRKLFMLYGLVGITVALA
jgi:hypothetical protein